MLCALLVFDAVKLPAPLSELSPWLDMRTRPIEDVRRALEDQEHRRFIKTHTPLDGIPFDDRPTYVCVGRDPRDAALSMNHHLAEHAPASDGGAGGGRGPHLARRSRSGGPTEPGGRDGAHADLDRGARAAWAERLNPSPPCSTTTPAPRPGATRRTWCWSTPTSRPTSRRAGTAGPPTRSRPHRRTDPGAGGGGVTRSDAEPGPRAGP